LPFISLPPKDVSLYLAPFTEISIPFHFIRKHSSIGFHLLELPVFFIKLGFLTEESNPDAHEKVLSFLLSGNHPFMGNLVLRFISPP